MTLTRGIPPCTPHMEVPPPPDSMQDVVLQNESKMKAALGKNVKLVPQKLNQ